MNELLLDIVSQQLPKFIQLGEDGRWIFHLDNHLCATFDSCPRRFQYRHITHIAPKGLTRFKMQLGSWWSLVMKDYYEQFAKSPATADKEFIMRTAAKQWLELKMDSYKTGTPTDIANYDAFGGHLGAMNMALSYWLTWSDLDAKTLRVIGAESGFGLKNEVLVGETNRVVVYLTGIPDLVVLENGKYLAPLDHKSKDYIEPSVLDEYKPDNQLTGYCFAVRELAKQLGHDYSVDYAIVNLCGRLIPRKPKDAAKQPTPRYRRLTVYFSQEEIEEWRQGRLQIAERMRSAFEQDFFPRTDNRIECHAVYNSPCSYRPICKLPPAHRAIEIRSNYTQIEPWEPYKLGKE